MNVKIGACHQSFHKYAHIRESIHMQMKMQPVYAHIHTYIHIYIYTWNGGRYLYAYS